MLKFTAKYVAKGVMSEPIDDACLEVGEERSARIIRKR